MQGTVNSRRETNAASLVRTEHMFGKCCLSLVPMQPDAHCHRDTVDSRVSVAVIKAGFAHITFSLCDS